MPGPIVRDLLFSTPLICRNWAIGLVFLVAHAAHHL